MELKTSSFGKIRGQEETTLFTLTNDHGIRAAILNFGASLVSLEVPDRDGKLADVVLGYDSIKDYETNPPYFGVCIGRVANRIKGGRFTLDGVEYQLAQNLGENHLHGGIVGFSKVLWTPQVKEEAGALHVILSYLSPDGDENYPGNLDCRITYSLTNENELIIDYHATTDKPTIVNLTNHSYFNLAGQGHGDILSHEMMINADEYTVPDETLTPTGEIRAIEEGSSLDFRRPMPIGKRLVEAGGYDHNFVVKKKLGEYGLSARVVEPESGRVMEIYQTQPGVQLYSGNFLGEPFPPGSKINPPGKAGAVYEKHSGFCLETQHYADSPNHPEFPSIVLRPGQTYHQKAVHKFSAK